jgi:hypothetical protein
MILLQEPPDMTSSSMQPPTSSSKLVAEHRKASRRLLKRVLKSRASARAYLVEAGILTKSGGLAAPYRAK